MKVKLLLVLIALLGILLHTQAFASGYHPFFNEAKEKAVLIVTGKVVKEWEPAGKNEKAEHDFFGAGMLYRLTVTDVYKGSASKNDTVLIWDPDAGSTAGYYIQEGNTSLLFLVEDKPDDFLLKNYDFPVGQLNIPIGNYDKNDDSSSEEFDGWVFLLDMVVRQTPKNDLDTYKRLLDENKNRIVLNYVVVNWPRKLTADDAQLFRDTARKWAEDPFVSNYAIQRLVEDGYGFQDDQLVALLKKADSMSREDLLVFVNAENISKCQSILFSWLLDDDDMEDQATIEKLAVLSPAYLKQQLRGKKLPFWTLIPCLQELHINGSAIGKPNYPRDVLNANPYSIRAIGDVFKGDTFALLTAMDDYGERKELAKLVTLLDPLLANSKPETMRIVVAFMRTCGFNVRRKGNGYVRAKADGAIYPAPIKVSIKAEKDHITLGEPLKVKVTETSNVNSVWVARQGELRWTLSCENGSLLFGESFWRSIKKLPRSEYTDLKKGMSFSKIEHIGSLIDRPGTYTIKLAKEYTHDGLEIGVDAWTGLISSSNTIKVEVVESSNNR